MEKRDERGSLVTIQPTTFELHCCGCFLFFLFFFLTGKNGVFPARRRERGKRAAWKNSLVGSLKIPKSLRAQRQPISEAL
nr:hypothetical protein Iba_chr06bCG5130 [Ipomoea batatas]